MKPKIKPKSANMLFPTDIFFQTFFWGRVKSKLGWQVSAFDLSTSYSTGDVLVLTKQLNDESSVAYIPQGPEYGPDPDAYGSFLEHLSASLTEHMNKSLIYIRYDLPWVDPYAADISQETLSSKCLQTDLFRPENRLRELRMNYTTDRWNLHKAPFDLTVADSLTVDLTGTEDEILGKMKPKTRYNIKLAAQKGVGVIEADMSFLPVFYELYLQTADRNGFSPCGYKPFHALFTTDVDDPHSPRKKLLLAVYKKEVLAGAVILFSGTTAHYLFGASSNNNRNLMGPYSVQWKAMKIARGLGCRSYDMGAVSPYRDEFHPFNGMYRFKTGFGGRIEHRVGTWDYPINQDAYAKIRNSEMLCNNIV